MREAFEKLSEEYNNENSKYKRIEMEAAEKEFHKAEDLYYKLQRAVDEGGIEVTRLKNVQTTMKTNKDTHETKMGDYETEVNKI